MADDFTIEQIRKAIADRIANIETAKQKHGTTDFLGGYEDAAMIQWLLDRLEKAEAALEAVKVQVREAIAAWHDSEALRIFDRLGDVAGVHFHRNAAASIRAMKGGA